MKFLSPKFYWLFACLLLMCAVPAAQAQKKSSITKGNSEGQLVFRINSCLANEDVYCYLRLFPDMDTLSKIVMANTQPGTKDYKEMAALQEQPVRLMHIDSVFQARLKDGFEALIAQGKQEGIHWSGIIPVRYELVKALRTRDEVYEKMAPDRFTGYFFIMDGLTRKTYGYTISEMLRIKEEWYGGYLGGIYEAATRDEYEDARAAAKREQKKPADTAAAADDAEKTIPEKEEENDNAVQKMIAERKYYKGLFDNEIPVQLYVRSLKGTCKEGICSWEAIYKFGDQDDYVLLTVQKTADDNWVFTEDPPLGSMELKLSANNYTGTWTAADNQTGYEVSLTESPASKTKIERLEQAFYDLKHPAKK